MIVEIVSKVCSLFLIIGIGAATAKCGLLSEGSIPTLNKLLFNVMTPAVVFTTMQGQTFEGPLVHDTVWSFISYTLVTLLMGILSFLLTGVLRAPERDRGIYRMQLVFKNIGFMGTPLAAVLGERSGLVILAAGWSLPKVVNSSLKMISSAMVPLGMLIVGIQLSRTHVSKVLNRRSLWFCVLSLAVVPALTMGICRLLPQSNAVTGTLVFAMAMPAGTMCSMLAEEFGRDTLLAAETLMLSTLLSLGTLPVWAVILTHIYHLG